MSASETSTVSSGYPQPSVPYLYRWETKNRKEQPGGLLVSFRVPLELFTIYWRDLSVFFRSVLLHFCCCCSYCSAHKSPCPHCGLIHAHLMGLNCRLNVSLLLVQVHKKDWSVVGHWPGTVEGAVSCLTRVPPLPCCQLDSGLTRSPPALYPRKPSPLPAWTSAWHVSESGAQTRTDIDWWLSLLHTETLRPWSRCAWELNQQETERRIKRVRGGKR